MIDFAEPTRIAMQRAKRWVPALDTAERQDHVTDAVLYRFFPDHRMCRCVLVEKLRPTDG